MDSPSSLPDQVPGGGGALWGGRSGTVIADAMEPLNRSLDVDWRLWPHDVRGSRAWARGLGRAGILTSSEVALIDQGLVGVAKTLSKMFGPQGLVDEDIHTVVERLLTAAIGPLGGKLHTGRSRNDQVATDLRLWGKEAMESLGREYARLIQKLLDKSIGVEGVLMPGYTHLQQAQPVPAAHWLLSRAWPLLRDLEALGFAYRECDVMPLGSGALAGCPFSVDRPALAKDLGFACVSENSMDAVSDRDWVVRLTFATALTGIHLSQLCEDLVLFSSAEFGFVVLGEGFVTGSSLMPQKRNPDVAELIRGKSGRLVGNLVAGLTMLKGLPTGYNRDLQEDKGALFDSVDTVMVALPALRGAVAGLSLDHERMAESLKSELLATDIADYLVRRHVPFRESHHAVGRLVRKAVESGRALDALSLEEIQQVHGAFREDVFTVLDAQRSTESRAVCGGTSPSALRRQRRALADALTRTSGWFAPSEAGLGEAPGK